MEFIPIKERPEENEEFIHNPLYGETILMVMDFYKKIGYVPPWICYLVSKNGEWVGSARTLMENNFSTRILEKNAFKFIGTVHDPEDGNVWQWEFIR